MLCTPGCATGALEESATREQRELTAEISAVGKTVYGYFFFILFFLFKANSIEKHFVISASWL